MDFSFLRAYRRVERGVFLRTNPGTGGPPAWWRSGIYLCSCSINAQRFCGDYPLEQEEAPSWRFIGDIDSGISILKMFGNFHQLQVVPITNILLMMLSSVCERHPVRKSSSKMPSPQLWTKSSRVGSPRQKSPLDVRQPTPFTMTHSFGTYFVPYARQA